LLNAPSNGQQLLRHDVLIFVCGRQCLGQRHLIVTKMHTARLCYYALRAAVTKKTITGNCQGMLNKIQYALTIADFAIDYPALLEINHKFAVIGHHLPALI
jgi:hypothetical protein